MLSDQICTWFPVGYVVGADLQYVIGEWFGLPVGYIKEADSHLGYRVGLSR